MIEHKIKVPPGNLIELTILWGDTPFHVAESVSCIGQGISFCFALESFFTYNSEHDYTWLSIGDVARTREWYMQNKPHADWSGNLPKYWLVTM